MIRAIQKPRDSCASSIAAAGDFDALEEVYGSLGHWEELVDALHAVADRRASRAERLELLERAARIASAHLDQRERAARAYERILSVEPTHLAAATELAPIYRETRRWARLLATYEILLGHAEEAGDTAQQLSLLAEIRGLCENDLGSKAQAFEWAARSWRLAPDDESLLAELERLGAEADAWSEVTDILASRAAAAGTRDKEKLRLYRELGKIAAGRLHKPDRAVDYLRRVLELAPDDPAAMDALEEIATQQADWPELLNIYRRRAAIEGERSRRLDLLFKIAFIEEERLADPRLGGRHLPADSRSRRRFRARVAPRAQGTVETSRGRRRFGPGLRKRSRVSSSWRPIQTRE